MSCTITCFRALQSNVTSIAAAIVCICWLAQLSGSIPARAAPRAKPDQAADELVRTALRREIDGADDARQDLLQSALERSPRNPAARWHTGHVRIDGNKWLHIDEVPQRAEHDRNLAKYRHRREQAADTVEGQLELANWCARRGLADQQRAHLTRVLEFAPEHAEARARLGFVRVDGIWLSQREIAAAQTRSVQAATALAEWRPKLERILAGLAAKSPKQRTAALERWNAIDDPAAILAVEVLFFTKDEETAHLALAKLSEMAAPEVSLALARQAVFSPWPTVRAEAGRLLSVRPFEGFVPELLAAMVTPLAARREIYRSPEGRLIHRLMFYREGRDRGELAVFDTSYGRIGALPGVRSGPLLRAEADAQETEAMLAQAMAEQNAATSELNERIGSVLATATGHREAREPEDWWRWWNQHNEVYAAGEKPVVETFRSRDVIVTGSSGSELQTSDCLAAGTLVWTDLGPVAIESVQVGDRVLSQDPESGELDYKPVLRTTIRPPGLLVKLEANGETIQVSGGHPLWIAGQGWVKARDLRPGDPLHSVTGSARIASAEPGSHQPTYNLVVADFHTYFAGETRILSHDNTVRGPTTTVVPGLTLTDD